MQLENKVAIVTGAATGIGQAIACAFAREGAAVAIDYVGSGSDAQAMVDQIKRDGGRAVAISADISQPDQVSTLVSSTVDAFGRLDIMVNNAGIEKDMPFLETPVDLWNKIIAVDLTGAFLCSQAAAKQMVKQGQGGRIINISSVHEDLPKPTGVPYCAAKGGMRMMMRTMCVELAPYGITVNNVGPGAIDTPLDAPLKADPAKMKELLDEIPLHRMGQPDEVADLAIYLASDRSAYITGSSYFIDGGLMRFSKNL